MRKVGNANIRNIASLRRRGFSIPEMSNKLGIAKSTVSRYARHVAILPQYRDRWLARRNASKITAERNWEFAHRVARQLLEKVNERDLKLIAAALYWAEGAKRDFSFSNTDPEMIRLFLYALRKVFNIKDARIKISLRLYEDLNKKQCLKFWSKTTSVHLNKSTSIYILQGSKKGKLQYGMCRVRIRKGGLLLKEFSAIMRRVNTLTGSRSSMDRTAHS